MCVCVYVYLFSYKDRYVVYDITNAVFPSERRKWQLKKLIHFLFLLSSIYFSYGTLNSQTNAFPLN